MRIAVKSCYTVIRGNLPVISILYLTDVGLGRGFGRYDFLKPGIICSIPGCGITQGGFCCCCCFCYCFCFTGCFHFIPAHKLIACSCCRCGSSSCSHYIRMGIIGQHSYFIICGFYPCTSL